MTRKSWAGHGQEEDSAAVTLYRAQLSTAWRVIDPSRDSGQGEDSMDIYLTSKAGLKGP